ncbi:MAG: GatB/YqeY domain-containing protein [Ilumatobacteraceae bacterium]
MSTTLKEQLRSDLTDAMKARDALTTSVLRMTLTAVSTAEVSGTESTTLDDTAVLAIIIGEVKRRVESAGIYAAAGRQELAATEHAERGVLERYLPAAMADDELNTIVTEEVAAAAERGATGPKAMGGIIGAVRARTGGAAESSRIAAAVKAAL